MITVQEKYGKSSASGAAKSGLEEDEDYDMDSSTDSEDEDDEGVLASEALDVQIQETLEAIRKKDPRVYDEKAKFYTEVDEGIAAEDYTKSKEPKPMYLSDYHRRNLLESGVGTTARETMPPTYAQQQDNLRNIIVKEMHATAEHEDSREQNDIDEDEGFLVPKVSKAEVNGSRLLPKSRDLDVESADKEPETYLSNFMSARAWVPQGQIQFQPFESDDEAEERRAELFEEAYNLRFEDPNTSNEKLMSHARDAATKYSVRKESLNPRKRARDTERAKKEAERQVREEEKARLRKLKVSEVEEKIQKIKDAAGLKGKSLAEEGWSTFLEEGWDDEEWEHEMRRRFGDDYYADHDSDWGEADGEKRKRKTKKPKWDDDIDIKDLIPNFNTGEGAESPPFRLSDHSDIEEGASIDNGIGKSSINGSADQKSRKRDRGEKKKEMRRERRKVERLVDERMKVDDTLSNFGKKRKGHFRYRETSPLAYGLTPHDILMASDSQLNQYAGLKKMAAFRDSDKKKKDKKHLGKKARLRQWRKDTFGNEHGPQQTLADVIGGKEGAGRDDSHRVMTNGIHVRTGKGGARKVKKNKA